VRRRSSWALFLGLVGLIASWAFGSLPAAVIGVGFLLLAGWARAWARLVRGSVDLERRLLPGERVEGSDVVVEVRTAHRRRLLGASVTVRQRLGSQEQSARMLGARTLVTFTELPRGRHELAPAEVVLTDTLALERVEQTLGEASHVLVRPRIPRLGGVFSARGARAAGVARSGLRRPTGFEIHAVRDYAPGEPLRSVHWPTTARRGRLMVKELEDAPHEDVVIVLDQDPDGVAGPPGASSFDAAVRAAGALALAHVTANRRVALVGSDTAFGVVRLRTTGSDWEAALDALAAVEPVDGARVERTLRGPGSSIAQAREIVVVTGLPARAATALQELRRGGRTVSLVAVAAQTYAGQGRGRPEPDLLRAAAHGIPVAVVSAEVPLEVALAGQVVGAVGA
jgi:uncharacterized protein (DUF58 family)